LKKWKVIKAAISARGTAYHNRHVAATIRQLRTYGWVQPAPPFPKARCRPKPVMTEKKKR